MKNIYVDGRYLSNHPTWHDHESAWKAQYVVDIITKNHLNPSTICDIGCGAGGILEYMSTNLPMEIKYYGYDISPQAFAICSKKTKENLSFSLGEPPPGRSFDVVMALDVMEHLEDYFAFLRNIKTKGTYKIFHVPLELSARAMLGIGPTLYCRKFVGHIHFFTKELVMAVLEDTGYEIIDFGYSNYALDCPASKWRVALTKIPRDFLFSLNPDFFVRLLGGYNLIVLAK